MLFGNKLTIFLKNLVCITAPKQYIRTKSDYKIFCLKNQINKTCLKIIEQKSEKEIGI